MTTTDTTHLQPAESGNKHKRALLFMHIATLALSVVLITYITYDTLRNVSFLADPEYMRVQFWICMFFILDVAVEWALSPKKLKFILGHILFILISIPYLNIISHWHIEVNYEIQYLLRFVPMIRAAYVLSIVSGAMSSNWVSSMFSVYLILLLSTLYFGSLMFFVAEHYVNPGIPTYWSALWWSIMDMTTCGCNVNPITPTGKVIAVIFSAEGLILFPVFTVYLTNALTRKSDDTESESQQAQS